MLEAFSFGAPPHGGIALGLIVSSPFSPKRKASGTYSLPQDPKGQDLMTDSPGTATERQLRDLHARLLPGTKQD